MYEYFNKFREKSLEERKNTSNMIKSKYKNRIPIIIDSNDKLKLEKNKYIVPSELSISEFLYIIRKKLTIKSTDAIYIMCNNKLMNSIDTINSIYNNEMSDDGFLYFIISLENTFG